jgi:2,5-diketo-D-gluconate reductase B
MSKVIPQLGLGTYPLMGHEAEDVITLGIELGFRHIDTAQMYGNEAAVGNALRRSRVPRNELFVVSKVDPGNLSALRFASSVARSVDELGGPVDLLLIHWPPADDEVDAVIGRLMAEQEQGKTRHIGVSNFPVALMERAQRRAGGRIICNQVEFHPLIDQSRLLAAAGELRIMLTAYSPLARGRALQLASVQSIARKLGRPPSEIVLRWIIQQGVAAIPMSRKRENLASGEDMTALSALGSAAGRTISRASMQGRWD